MHQFSVDPNLYSIITAHGKKSFAGRISFDLTKSVGINKILPMVDTIKVYDIILPRNELPFQFFTIDGNRWSIPARHYIDSGDDICFKDFFLRRIIRI